MKRYLILFLLTTSSWATTAAISTPANIRAGLSISLAGSGTGTGALIYFWTQLSGPSTGKWSTRTSTTPIFTVLFAGSYTIQLEVTDSVGVKATATVIVGVTATDVNGVILTNAGAGADFILGNLTRLGTSPWPYYDIAEPAILTDITTAALANQPYLGVALTGTSTFDVGYERLTGVGTLFTSEVTVGACLVVAWNTVDGNGTGRHTGTVSAISDDTHLQFVNYLSTVPTGQAGLTIYRCPTETATAQYGWWGVPNTGNANASNNSWNYYDAGCLTNYREYYRTGNVTYLNNARIFCDIWWQWGIDHGYQSFVPRTYSLLGQFLRATDGKLERLAGLRALIVYEEGRAYDFVGQGVDVREAGYMIWFESVGAKLDSTNRTAYCAKVVSNATAWISFQNINGYWSEHPQGYPYLEPGTAPWRSAIAGLGLQAAYDVLADTGVCNNTALAALLLPKIQKFVDFTYLAGRSPDRGIYYDVYYPNEGQDLTSRPGTISVNLGSNIVTGSSTTFLSTFNCNNTDYIGIGHGDVPPGGSMVYKVASCSGNLGLTLATNFGTQSESGNVSGVSYYRTAATTTSCGASVAPNCSAPARNLVRLTPKIHGWMYLHSGLNPIYKTRGDEYASAFMGGPSGGPGSGTSCGGPNCDNVEGDWVGSLRSCTAFPYPPTCSTNDFYVGGNVYQYIGKNFGEGSGAPGAQNYLADRLGGILPPSNKLVKFSGKISSCAGCSKMQVTVTNLSGAVESTTICGSSPCDVMVDTRLGDSTFQIDYLNSSNIVLVPGTKLRLYF